MSEDRRDKWEMPKPIFRQSSGFTPRGYGKRDKEWVDATHEDMKSVQTHDAMLLTMYAPPTDLVERSLVEEEIPTQELTLPGPAIEEQPTITEQFSMPEPPPPAAAAASAPAAIPPLPRDVSYQGKKSSVIGKILVVLGIVALLGAGAIVAVYYFIYNSQSQNNNF